MFEKILSFMINDTWTHALNLCRGHWRIHRNVERPLHSSFLTNGKTFCLALRRTEISPCVLPRSEQFSHCLNRWCPLLNFFVFHGRVSKWVIGSYNPWRYLRPAMTCQRPIVPLQGFQAETGGPEYCTLSTAWAPWLYPLPPNPIWNTLIRCA